MRKSVIFAIKRCFRSICNHPFLVVMLCLLVFMYRTSPFLFSLLVSASPVLVCTAVLLGTLLSFGQENVPAETEIEEKKCHETVLMKTGEGLLKEAVVVDQNGSYYVAKLSEETIKDRGLDEESSKEPSILVVKQIGEICREVDLDETPVVISGGERIEDNWEEANNELLEKNIENNEYASIPKADDENMEMGDEKTGVDVEEEEEDNEDDDEALESGSEAESSSPEASMSEVLPMLDELHPLLDEDGPQAVQTSHDGSSSDDEDDDDDVTELEVEDHDNNRYGKVEKKKSAITWTEEDQRNLMDLGSSEIERNQRLENLLMRRRARKNMSMGPQMSLIDFDPADDELSPSFNLPPSISTKRQNPFDEAYDNDDSGLPPIPGSAPSILLPRRNPFDTPYNASQEKLEPPPTMEDHGFETSLQSREPAFFRRHESFNVGPSIFASHKQDVHFRPFFVPEASGDSSYSVFHRIPSEVSESKASSARTESVGSIEDLEDHKLPQEDHTNNDHHNNINHDHPREVSRMDEREEVSEKNPLGDHDEMVSKVVSDEPELISKIGHGSHTSGEDEDEFDVNLKFHSQDVENLYEEGDLALYSCSSSSSLSETDQNLFTETDVEKPKIKTPTSVESSALIDDVHHKEPIYDTSPHSHAEKPDLILPPVIVKRTVSFVERKTEIRDTEKESSDSDADVFHEVNEKLVCTPSAAGGTTTVFYDVMHEHNFELLDEVQVPNTPVEAFDKPRTITNLNIPEVHELDHDMSPNFNSPITPDFISMPSSAASEEEGATSHADTRTINQQTNKIKEIDGLLSTLEKVGLTRWESCSNELEKNTDMKDAVSEMPELEAKRVKDIDAVYEKFGSKENQLEKNTDKKLDTNTVSEMPELEAKTVKDIDAVYKKLSDKENELEKKTDTVTVSEMPELEAKSVKDIDAVYNKFSKKEIDKPNMDKGSLEEIKAEKKVDSSTSLTGKDNISKSSS